MPSSPRNRQSTREPARSSRRKNDGSAQPLSKEQISRKQLNALAVFEEWVAWRRDLDQARAIGDDTTSEYQYQTIWIAWLRFLCGQKTKWVAATGADVLAFINNNMRGRGTSRDLDPSALAPQQSGGAAAAGQRASSRRREPSRVSKRRYATVLSNVYEHAKRTGHCTENPVPRFDKDLPANESANSLVLNKTYRAELVRNLPEAADARSARDRAMLAVMLRQGLTCSEVMELTLTSLDFGPDALLPDWSQPWDDAVAPLSLHITNAIAERPEQPRVLALDKVTAEALQKWLRVRGTFTAARVSPLLFVSKHHRKTTTKRGGKDVPCVAGALTARAVFYVASVWLRETLKKRCFMQDVYHAGPNVLRNACIVDWLEQGLAFEEVRRRAGLKRMDSLERLIYQSHPDVVERYRTYLQEQGRHERTLWRGVKPSETQGQLELAPPQP